MGVKTSWPPEEAEAIVNMTSIIYSTQCSWGDKVRLQLYSSIFHQEMPSIDRVESVQGRVTIVKRIETRGQTGTSNSADIAKNPKAVASKFSADALPEVSGNRISCLTILFEVNCFFSHFNFINFFFNQKI